MKEMMTETPSGSMVTTPWVGKREILHDHSQKVNVNLGWLFPEV